MKQHQLKFLASHGDADHSREIAKMEPWRSIHYKNASNPSTPSDVIDHYMDIDKLKTDLARNPNLEMRHVDALAIDPNREVGFIMTKHPKIEKHHMEKMLKDREGDAHEIWKSGLARRHNLPPEIFNHILKTGSISTRAALLGSEREQNKPLNDRELEDVIKDKNSLFLLPDNKQITSVQISKVLNSGHAKLRDWILHPNVEREHLKSMIESDDPEERQHVVESGDRVLSKEDIEQFTRDPDERVRATIATHPKVTDEQLSRLKNDPSELVRKNAEVGRENDRS